MSFIFCFILLLSIPANATIFYGICYGTCMAACIISDVLLPPGVSITDHCMVYCPAVCVIACVSEDTTVIKLDPEHNVSIITPINEIIPGDIIRTLSNDGTMIWTTVIKNIDSKDNITFNDIEFKEINITLRE